LRDYLYHYPSVTLRNGSGQGKVLELKRKYHLLPSEHQISLQVEEQKQLFLHLPSFPTPLLVHSNQSWDQLKKVHLQRLKRCSGMSPYFTGALYSLNMKTKNLKKSSKKFYA